MNCLLTTLLWVSFALLAAWPGAAYAQIPALQWLQTLPDRALPDTIDVSVFSQLDRFPAVAPALANDVLLAPAPKLDTVYAVGYFANYFRKEVFRNGLKVYLLSKERLLQGQFRIGFLLDLRGGPFGGEAYVWVLCTYSATGEMKSCLLGDLQVQVGDSFASLLWWREGTAWLAQEVSTGYGGGGGFLGCDDQRCQNTWLSFQYDKWVIAPLGQCLPNRHYRDAGTTESLAFHCCGDSCLVAYKARTPLSEERNYSTWPRLLLIAKSADSRVWIVQFPNSATTYTLTFSPDFERLTSRGSDGSAVQTFVHIP